MSTVVDTTIDLGDHGLWKDGPPYALFEQLQREPGVHFSANAHWPEEDGFYSLVRAADVAAATRDLATFSSERRGIFVCDDIGVPLDIQRLQMISMDPPRHDRLKKLVGKAFTPARIAAHEDAVRQIVRSVLDRFSAGDRIDLAVDVARPVPARVIGSLLGTPEEDDHKLVHWTNVVTAWEDPEIRAGWDSTIDEFQEIVAYIEAVRQDRAQHLGDDLLSALLTAEVDGEHLEPFEIATFFILLLAAGNDSTRATYVATMRALIEHPEQRQLLLDDPSRIPQAVEEGLRCFPAFGFMGRATTQEVEIGGQTIPEGARVLLWYLASNRDPEVFPDPHRFDVTRENLDRHQAFGAGGRHFCLGTALARMELRIWIEETLARWPAMELDGPGTRMESLFLNQWKRSPVVLAA
ncbi:cytochrome P450 [Patulibacter brassicae]|uniref:Cytochrome P450 n=1 Tax=Patulibacter brassicae TaxID=1705717 RepID=A0ABU4VIF5_9ACTN|nr:cytochrome P450 [Patulibacter brassicae]MDX8151614.1 cytochrome P450 [Patulibacter brassicae]